VGKELREDFAAPRGRDLLRHDVLLSVMREIARANIARCAVKFYWL